MIVYFCLYLRMLVLPEEVSKFISEIFQLGIVKLEFKVLKSDTIFFDACNF